MQFVKLLISDVNSLLVVELLLLSYRNDQYVILDVDWFVGSFVL